MTELSEEALHNLYYTALSFADKLFQMWLTVTVWATSLALSAWNCCNTLFHDEVCSAGDNQNTSHK